MTSLLPYAWAGSPERLALAAATTVAFGLLGRAVRGVDWSGAAAGGLACLGLFVGAGPFAFIALAALFAMTWLSTRAGYRMKTEFGLAERRGGRNAWQVLANLAVAAFCAMAFAATGNHPWMVASIAALAEAATDTVASEIGQSRSGEARMITTWQRVPIGVDGGVTIRGTLTGAAAGIIVAIVADAGGIVSHSQLWIPIAAGFAGMIADSFLGATIQRRGWISNRGVNLLASAGAAALAYLLSR